MDGTEQASAALKEIFNRRRLVHIGTEAKAVWPQFDPARFLAHATRNLDDLGIMQRTRQVAEALHETLPADFAEAAPILEALAPRIGHGFATISLCEYVALYGTDDFETAMATLRHLTRFGSAEFAIRPFLLREQERTLSIMRDWAEDENEHVRRLASEGSRPRLPWSFQLKTLQADPSLAWPILDRLNDDASPYVRKSVANHLNDISKDHPDWLLARLANWPVEQPSTRWIVGHALRTLIKKGETRALAMVGSTGKPQVEVATFAVTPARLALGERLTLEATLRSTSETPQRLVVDYAIHYVKKSGGASRKVFKLKAIDLTPGAERSLSISQTIRDFTTRSHNAGHHRIELVVNGETLAEGGFDLVMP